MRRDAGSTSRSRHGAAGLGCSVSLVVSLLIWCLLTRALQGYQQSFHFDRAKLPYVTRRSMGQNQQRSSRLRAPPLEQVAPTNFKDAEWYYSNDGNNSNDGNKNDVNDSNSNSDTPMAPVRGRGRVNGESRGGTSLGMMLQRASSTRSSLSSSASLPRMMMMSVQRRTTNNAPTATTASQRNREVTATDMTVGDVMDVVNTVVQHGPEFVGWATAAACFMQTKSKSTKSVAPTSPPLPTVPAIPPPATRQTAVPPPAASTIYMNDFTTRTAEAWRAASSSSWEREDGGTPSLTTREFIQAITNEVPPVPTSTTFPATVTLRTPLSPTPATPARPAVGVKPAPLQPRVTDTTPTPSWNAPSVGANTAKAIPVSEPLAPPSSPSIFQRAASAAAKVFSRPASPPTFDVVSSRQATSSRTTSPAAKPPPPPAATPTQKVRIPATASASEAAAVLSSRLAPKKLDDSVDPFTWNRGNLAGIAKSKGMASSSSSSAPSNSAYGLDSGTMPGNYGSWKTTVVSSQKDFQNSRPEPRTVQSYYPYGPTTTPSSTPSTTATNVVDAEMAIESEIGYPAQPSSHGESPVPSPYSGSSQPQSSYLDSLVSPPSFVDAQLEETLSSFEPSPLSSDGQLSESELQANLEYLESVTSSTMQDAAPVPSANEVASSSFDTSAAFQRMDATEEPAVAAKSGGFSSYLDSLVPPVSKEEDAALSPNSVDVMSEVFASAPPSVAALSLNNYKSEVLPDVEYVDAFTSAASDTTTTKGGFDASTDYQAPKSPVESDGSTSISPFVVPSAVEYRIPDWVTKGSTSSSIAPPFGGSTSSAYGDIRETSSSFGAAANGQSAYTASSPWPATKESGNGMGYGGVRDQPVVDVGASTSGDTESTTYWSDFTDTDVQFAKQQNDEEATRARSKNADSSSYSTTSQSFSSPAPYMAPMPPSPPPVSSSDPNFSWAFDADKMKDESNAGNSYQSSRPFFEGGNDSSSGTFTSYMAGSSNQTPQPLSSTPEPAPRRTSWGFASSSYTRFAEANASYLDGNAGNGNNRFDDTDATSRDGTQPTPRTGSYSNDMPPTSPTQTRSSWGVSSSYKKGAVSNGSYLDSISGGNEADNDPPSSNSLYEDTKWPERTEWDESRPAASPGPNSGWAFDSQQRPSSYADNRPTFDSTSSPSMYRRAAEPVQSKWTPSRSTSESQSSLSNGSYLDAISRSDSTGSLNARESRGSQPTTPPVYEGQSTWMSPASNSQSNAAAQTSSNNGSYLDAISRSSSPTSPNEMKSIGSPPATVPQYQSQPSWMSSTNDNPYDVGSLSSSSSSTGSFLDSMTRPNSPFSSNPLNSRSTKATATREYQSEPSWISSATDIPNSVGSLSSPKTGSYRDVTTLSNAPFSSNPLDARSAEPTATRTYQSQSSWTSSTNDIPNNVGSLSSSTTGSYLDAMSRSNSPGAFNTMDARSAEPTATWGYQSQSSWTSSRNDIPNSVGSLSSSTTGSYLDAVSRSNSPPTSNTADSRNSATPKERSYQPQSKWKSSATSNTGPQSASTNGSYLDALSRPNLPTDSSSPNADMSSTTPYAEGMSAPQVPLSELSAQTNFNWAFEDARDLGSQSGFGTMSSSAYYNFGASLASRSVRNDGDNTDRRTQSNDGLPNTYQNFGAALASGMPKRNDDKKQWFE